MEEEGNGCNTHEIRASFNSKLGLSSHLFVKVPRPWDSDVTFSVI